MSLAQGHSPSESAHTFQSAPDGALGSLKGCLVEGDAEQLARERRVRRKALAISVAFQVAVLLGLVLLPIFGTVEKIAYGVTPVPLPYGVPGASQNPVQRPAAPHRGHSIWHGFVPHPPQHGDRPSNPRDNSGGGWDEPGFPTPGFREGIPDLWIGNADPRRLIPPAPTAHTQPRVIITTIEPAMLLRRVEPVYPPLARQIHREGRVELRAIISTDGTIQSLEAVGGDPMFFPSALDAVRQWRYRPTILNGAPVEVETRITVIYTLQR